MTSENEFSRTVKLADIGAGDMKHNIAASESERAALSERFDLLSLEKLEAVITVSATEKGISAKGKIWAELVQACTATGEPVPDSIADDIDLLFMAPPQHGEDAEIELLPDECEVIFHDGKVVDLGEAAAQSMGLAINPYPRSKIADEKLRAAGVKSEEEEARELEARKAVSGPFAGLAGLQQPKNKP
ncbi:YceD family protein [Sphingorhabdus arenilitoris]|uniref:YceD family protein n=1 Tax=Sphingorhabdus arenilitoris TaxID=1490041 RepID=A0ABV8RDM9_9SPHN